MRGREGIWRESESKKHGETEKECLRGKLSIVRECVYVMTQLQCKLESAVHGLTEQGATKAGETISLESERRRARPQRPTPPPQQSTPARARFFLNIE